MGCDEFSRAFDINLLKPGLDRPAVSYDHVPMNIEELTSNTPALCVQYKRSSKKDGPAPSVGSKIYNGLRTWNDESLQPGGDEQIVGVIVKASDLLSRSRAMISCANVAPS